MMPSWALSANDIEIFIEGFVFGAASFVPFVHELMADLPH